MTEDIEAQMESFMCAIGGKRIIGVEYGNTNKNEKDSMVVEALILDGGVKMKFSGSVHCDEMDVWCEVVKNED